MLDKEGHCCVWFPFTLIAKLVTMLKHKPLLSQRRIQLQEAVENHLHSSAEESSKFLSKLNLEAVIGMEE